MIFGRKQHLLIWMNHSNLKKTFREQKLKKWIKDNVCDKWWPKIYNGNLFKNSTCFKNFPLFHLMKEYILKAWWLIVRVFLISQNISFVWYSIIYFETYNAHISFYHNFQITKNIMIVLRWNLFLSLLRNNWNILSIICIYFSKNLPTNVWKMFWISMTHTLCKLRFLS